MLYIISQSFSPRLIPPLINTLQVYGHRFLHTHYNKQRLELFGKESVSQAWGHIVATHLQYGLPDPRKSPYAQAHTGLAIRLTQHLKT